MNEHDKGQVSASAAEVYEQFFVPALFNDWTTQVVDTVGTQVGDSVLDVACGTGILAQEMLKSVGPSGRVVGLDINNGMLDVARAKTAEIDWRVGDSEMLPFKNGEFDRVVCQFGLMFFQNKINAISEMMRVLRVGGSGCVAVWADLSLTPGYLAVAKMLDELFGPEIARSIESPYCLGDTQILESLFLEAGANSVEIHCRPGKAHFESIDAWLHTDIRGWTLTEVIDDAGYERLRSAAPEYLSKFAKEGGRVEFDAPALLVTFV